MITQYTKPVEQNFISQYVPIPFDQINKITDAYARDYKESSDKLDAFVKEYSKFKSLSNADMKTYHDLTFGAIKPIVDKVGNNSDMLATAEGRSLLNSAIRNIDYATLESLQKTAEELDKENKLKMEMEANGKKIDYRFYDPNKSVNYDTLKEGKAYSAQTPIEYVPLKKIFDPLYDDIKPQITSHGMYNYKEITNGMLAKVTTDENINQFLTDPIVNREVNYNEATGKIPSLYYKKDSEGNLKLDRKAYIKDLAIQSQASRVGPFDKEVDQFKYAEYVRQQKEEAETLGLKNAIRMSGLNRTNDIKELAEKTAQDAIFTNIGKKINPSQPLPLSDNDFKVLNKYYVDRGATKQDVDLTLSNVNLHLPSGLSFPKAGTVGNNFIATINNGETINASRVRLAPRNKAIVRLARNKNGKIDKNYDNVNGIMSYQDGAAQLLDVSIRLDANDKGSVKRDGGTITINNKTFDVDTLIKQVGGKIVYKENGSVSEPYYTFPVEQDILVDAGSAQAFDYDYLNSFGQNEIKQNPNAYTMVQRMSIPLGKRIKK